MTPELSTSAEPDTFGGRDKPFPRYCWKCRQRAVQPAFIPYDTVIVVAGEKRTLHIPKLEVARCENCGDLSFGNRASDQMARAERDYLGILHADQIRAHRESLGFTQKQLGDVIGVSEETIAAWEDNLRIQTRPEDRFMRTIFSIPEARDAWSHPESHPGLVGQPAF